MGSVLTISMLVLTALTIIFGALFGLIRGSRRALLRLGLVVLCLVLAFAFRNIVTEKIYNAEITIETGSTGDVEGTEETEDAESTEPTTETISIAIWINNMLGAEAEELGLTDLAVPLVKTALNIVVFLILFGAFEFLSWAIVFPICQIFVKPKVVTEAPSSEDELPKTKRKYHRLAGAGIGLVQGLIVALCVCVLLTGMVVQSNKLLNAVSDMSSSNSGESSEEMLPPEGGEPSNEMIPSEVIEMIDNYLQSGIGKVYNSKAANKFVSLISSTKIDGEKKTLPGQVDALTKLLQLIGKMEELGNADMGNMFKPGSDSSPQTIRDFFYGLDEIVNGEGTTDETKKTINKAISNFAKSMGEQFGLPIDVSHMDFTDIDFRNEGDLLSDLYDYSQSETVTKEDIEDIIDKVTKSDLVLPILANADVNLGEALSDEQLEQVEDILDGLDNVDESKMDIIRKLFGLD